MESYLAQIASADTEPIFLVTRSCFRTEILLVKRRKVVGGERLEHAHILARATMNLYEERICQDRLAKGIRLLAPECRATSVHSVPVSQLELVEHELLFDLFDAQKKRCLDCGFSLLTHH